MPIYEYRCKDCENGFSRLQKVGAGNDGVKCPKCEGDKCRTPAVELCQYLVVSGCCLPVCLQLLERILLSQLIPARQVGAYRFKRKNSRLNADSNTPLVGTPSRRTFLCLGVAWKFRNPKSEIRNSNSK